MKYEYLRLVKVILEVWEYPAGNFRYSLSERGVVLACDDHFPSEDEAKVAGEMALARINGEALPEDPDNNE